MINQNSENVYIIWAYVGVVVGVLALIGWAIFDSRRIAARLKALEDKGVRRRSAGNAS